MDPVARQPRLILSTRSRTARVAAVVLVAGAASLSFTGCSALGDVVGQQVGSAACAIGASAVGQIASDVAAAVGDIAVDPAAAAASLQAAEAALAVAALSMTEEPAASAVAAAQAALADLRVLADDAANGGTIDAQAVSAAADGFAQAVAGIC